MILIFTENYSLYACFLILLKERVFIGYLNLQFTMFYLAHQQSRTGDSKNSCHIQNRIYSNENGSVVLKNRADDVFITFFQGIYVVIPGDIYAQDSKSGIHKPDHG